MNGTKHDSGKLRWDLIPFKALATIVKVITFGAKKYRPDNWKRLADPEDRYFAACMRHLASVKCGEIYDKETRILHLAHAGCNILFLIYFALEKETTP